MLVEATPMEPDDFGTFINQTLVNYIQEQYIQAVYYCYVSVR